MHIFSVITPPTLQGWLGLLLQTHTSFLPACDSLLFSPKLFLCEMDPLALLPETTQPNDIPQRFNIPGGAALFHSVFFFLSFFHAVPIYQRRACQSPGRRSSPLLQGLLRHEWLTTSLFFRPARMRAAALASDWQHLHKKIKGSCLKEWHWSPASSCSDLPKHGRIYF